MDTECRFSITDMELLILRGPFLSASTQSFPLKMHVSYTDLAETAGRGGESLSSWLTS